MRMPRCLAYGPEGRTGPAHRLHSPDRGHFPLVRNHPANLAVEHDVAAEGSLAAAEYALGGQMPLSVSDALSEAVAASLVRL
jgi:hypothetical protein